MLSTISWGQYIIFVGVSLLFYYCFIGLKYYRWEILSLIGIKKVENEKIFIPADKGVQHFKAPENPEDYLPKAVLETDISPLVQAFADEVQAFANSASPNMPKPELLFSLQLIALKYPVLKKADCKDEVSLIAFACINEKFPGLLNESEVLQLWHE